MKFRVYAYSVVGLVVVLIVMLSVSSQQTFTYRSKAREQSEQTISSLSQAVIALPASDRGTCVSSLTYLPTTDDATRSCFVQFVCTSGSSTLALPSSCAQEGALMTCDAQPPCQSISMWALQAQKYCGCT